MSDNKNDLIHHLKMAENLDTAFEIVEKILKILGLNHYMFTHMGIEDSPAVFKIHYHKTTYPDAWMRIYRERKYLYVDPVAKAITGNERPFFWSQYVLSMEQSPESMAMMAHAMEFNLVDGIGCSYLKNQGHLYTFTVSVDKMFTRYNETLLAEVNLIGAYLVKLHQQKNKKTVQYHPLTGRESEIISLAAMGKTDSEIAQMAGISINTVRYHWKNIFDKTNSYSRVFAIIRALNLGYIDSHIIEVTTDSGSIEKYRKTV